jgi:hypothetical protein
MKKNSPAIPEQRFEVSQYVRFPTPLEPTDERRVSELIGYLELGVPDLAVSCLGGMHSEILEHPELEALRLISLEQAGAPMEVLGELAWASLQRHPHNFRILEMAMIHLTATEHYARVLWLYQTYAHTPWMNGNLLQTVVAAAANCGHYKMALRLAEVVAATQDCSSDVLLDTQILPLWTRYAVSDMDAEETMLLSSPWFSRALDSAISGQVLSGVCPYTLKHLVPRKLKGWLAPSLDSAFRLRYDAPTVIKTRFHQWMESRRRQILRLVRRAIQNAKGRRIRLE